MARLSVNVDHVATLRKARGAKEPDPVAVALRAEMAGADGITVHLREDRRHIQDRDVFLIKNVLKSKFNLEMAATKEMLSIALEVKPDMVTIVPEKRQELTTEGGLDVRTHADHLKKFVATLRDGGIHVNLFIDPLPEAVKACHKIGSNGVEIHTGLYAEARGEAAKDTELKKIFDAATLSKRIGMKTHAGHGLDYHNITSVAAMSEGGSAPFIDEFAIGFSIIARSVYTGIEEAVREMKRLIANT